MRTKNIIIHISEVYQDLTKSEKKIADFITANPYESQYLSITSLAEECNVADATISRFCRALGYQGYNDFKLALAKHVAPQGDEPDSSPQGRVQKSDSVDTMARKVYASNVRAMKQSLELINQKDITLAAKYLRNANRVYCLGQGGSGVIAKEAWARFLAASSQFQCIEDSHMQIMAVSLCDTSDVVLFFSYSGATRDIVDILKVAKESGARVILVTHFPKCPAAVYADVIILCGSKESPLHGGSVAAKIGQLFLIDVLFNEYCRFNEEEYLSKREQTSDALANKHI